MISSFLNEINLTGCQRITFDAENGTAILTSIPAPQHPKILVTLSNKDILLGQLLYSLKQVSNALIDADST
jgi:hypothetical protein